MVMYNIRLNPNCASVVQTGLKFKTGDKGITLAIKVDELDTTGATAKIVFKRANGTSVESTISEFEGTYIYKIIGTEFAVPGKTVGDVKFYKEDGRVSTASFVFDVVSDTMDGLGAGASGYSDTLEKMVQDIEAVHDEMEAAAKEAEETQKAIEAVTKEAEQTQLELEEAIKDAEAELKEALKKITEEYAEIGALNPCGDWNNTTTYQFRDVVSHNNCIWISLVENVNVEPTEANSGTWMLALSASGASSEELQKIIDGTTPVGDTLKLGGKGANEYALGTDLANYLPKTGGTIEDTSDIASNAPLLIRTGRKNTANPNLALIGFLNNLSETLGFLGFDEKGSPVFRSPSGVNNKLLHSGNVGSYALPIGGGMIESYDPQCVPLRVKVMTDSTTPKSILSFIHQDTWLGNIGFNGLKPVVCPGDKSAFTEILHTGNKPSGSYVGNGSATSRTVDVGVSEKGIIIESSAGYNIFAGSQGAVKVYYADGTVSGLKNSEFRYSGGKIYIATTDAAVNASGITYKYTVL